MQLNLGMSLSRGYVRRLNKKLRYSWSTNKTRPLTCPTMLAPIYSLNPAPSGGECPVNFAQMGKLIC